MRFIPFAVLLAFIAHPTPGGGGGGGGGGNSERNAQRDCYCERNSLASRDYPYLALLSALKNIFSYYSAKEELDSAGVHN